MYATNLRRDDGEGGYGGEVLVPLVEELELREVVTRHRSSDYRGGKEGNSFSTHMLQQCDVANFSSTASMGKIKFKTLITYNIHYIAWTIFLVTWGVISAWTLSAHYHFHSHDVLLLSSNSPPNVPLPATVAVQQRASFSITASAG